MPTVVVGRDAELASIRDFVTGIADGASALVLEGEAGMGKTTLWRAAVEHAEASGLIVLQAEPVESETTLSFAGIGDLLDPVLDGALEPLPLAQRRSLTRALALGDEEGPALDPRTLRVALMNAIRALAETQPVLVAIDDSQWLDDASSAALAYGFRRFRTERIGVLLSRRSGLESVLLNELLHSPAGNERIRVLVGPLEPPDLGRVVQTQLGTSVPRPLLAEVHEASGGSPFYALEIVRMLKRTGVSIEAGQRVPLPESLRDLIHGRVLALPPESRDFLLAAASHAHPTIAIAEEVSGIARASGLGPALDARVVELDGQRIRFTHPLLAAGVYESASPLRRVEVHRRLAELLEDPEARAWQLAAAVDEPDESVAAVLEDAASRAHDRGALRAAALLLDRSGEMTPSILSGARVRRFAEAGELHFEAGDSPRAETRLRDLVDALPAGPDRARALSALARIRIYNRPNEALALFLRALDETDDDGELQAVAHEGVASCLVWLMERLDEAVRHAQITSQLAEQLSDSALAADAAIARLWAQAALGATDVGSTAAEALRLQDSATDRRLLDQPVVALAEFWMWTDSYAESRKAIHEMLARAEDLGDEASRPYLLFLLSSLQSVTSELDDALESARNGIDAASQAGQPLLAGFNVALEALALAQLGHGDALGAAERAVELAPENGYVELLVAAATGHHALSHSDADEAIARLEPCVEAVRRESIAEPGLVRLVIDQIEALIELGRREDAVELLDWYEGNARRLERISALANCARCRGMIAAQAGKLDAAFAAYGQALDWHGQVELPLDRGRTLLALGAALRRAKRRREARETLEEALAIFKRIGAALWAERARAELRRISGRAGTPGALTPAEERVAALAAEGKTNREVAAALYLSNRTVEGHLSRVFGKLGIKHRAELGSALAARQTQGVEAPNTGDSPVSAETVAP